MPDAPILPGLAFAFRITAQIAPALDAGAGPRGRRLHIAITGGSVAGPRLQGRILPGGSDWPLIRTDGSSEISASYTIEAADGTPIHVVNSGLRVSAPDVLARLRAGEPVDPADYYFRSAPRFEAPDGPHGWLNGRIFVASLMPTPSTASIIIDVYEVT